MTSLDRSGKNQKKPARFLYSCYAGPHVYEKCPSLRHDRHNNCTDYSQKIKIIKFIQKIQNNYLEKH